MPVSDQIVVAHSICCERKPVRNTGNDVIRLSPDCPDDSEELVGPLSILGQPPSIVDHCIHGDALMTGLIELVKAVGDVPLPTLIAMVLLAGFGLAAFAIYVIAKIAGTRTNGSSQ